MELPFNYIVFTIMEALKLRYMKTEVSLDTLRKYLSRLLKDLNLNEEELEELKYNFDFEEAIENLLSEHYDIIDIEDDTIILDKDVDGDQLWVLTEEAKVDYDSELIEDIIDIVDNDTFYIEVLGIKINTKLFAYFLQNEEKLEKFYNMLMNCERLNLDNSEVVNEIKKIHFMNRIMFFNMHSQISIDEYDDLALFSVEHAETENEKVEVPLKIHDTYDESNLDSTIMRSLLLVDPLYPFNLRDEFNYNLKKESNLIDNLDVSELKFYLELLPLIDEEIKNTSWVSLKKELLLAKYRLMNSIDSIYSTNLFMGEKIKLENFHEDYGFIESTVFYFIRELLEYKDTDYKNKSFKDDLVTVYYSIIKKLVIKTYYSLTNDPLVEAYIQSNNNYKINKRSTNLLEEILNDNKNKTKKKI